MSRPLQHELWPTDFLTSKPFHLFYEGISPDFNKHFNSTTKFADGMFKL